MSEKTVFLAWQDETRRWYPIGRLDAMSGNGYRFRYVRGAERAQREAGFEPLYDFPQMDRCYQSGELFPLFRNRVLSRGRRDFQEYLRLLNLSGDPDPIEILSVSGGYRATDSFEVFPKIEPGEDGAFCCRFFLHGWRYTSESAQQRLQSLLPDEKLYLALELTNPVTQLAVQIQTVDYQMIGWAPRYLVEDLTGTLTRSPGKYDARVVQVNPIPAPSKQRLLIELRGAWPGYEPMATEDFEPLTQ